MLGQMLKTSQSQTRANIELHKANIEIYLRHAVGVRDCLDVMKAM